MTEELKQAAQAALEAFDAFADADDFQTCFELTKKMNALRALTQRPAAQSAQQAVPMTPEQREAVYERAAERLRLDRELSWRHAIVSETEAHHRIGITAQVKK